MRQLVLLAAKGDLPANAVNRLVAADIDEPRAGIGRRLGRGPAFQRRREGLLQYVFGQIEIADEADQGGQRPARLVTKDLVDSEKLHLSPLFRDADEAGRPGISRCGTRFRMRPSGAPE